MNTVAISAFVTILTAGIICHVVSAVEQNATLTAPELADKELSFRARKNRFHGKNGWYIPQRNGRLKWMSMKEIDKIKLRKTKDEDRTFIDNDDDTYLGIDDDNNDDDNDDDVLYYLYTRRNPKKPQKLTMSKSSVARSNFNKNHGTRFLIHGWLMNSNSDMNINITKAWLSRGHYNIIVVDWSRDYSLNYIHSALDLDDVGNKVGDMIKFLHQNHDMSLDTLTVIGHSLGAHVAGFAGKRVGEGRINNIIALDAALPLFHYDKPRERLAADDAFKVECIHTSGGRLGFLKPIGTVDFYPNGGKKQPGCGFDWLWRCSHSRSVRYYVEAVQKNRFRAMRCNNYKSAVTGKCSSRYVSVRMGVVPYARNADGVYYVPVNKRAPYGTA